MQRVEFIMNYKCKYFSLFATFILLKTIFSNRINLDKLSNREKRTFVCSEIECQVFFILKHDIFLGNFEP